jgi:nucleotidyltransferase/DNA polymerase involved in DNA repair
VISLSDIKGIGPSTVKKLNKAKIFTVEELLQHSAEELNKIEGIGYHSALRWLSEAKKQLNKVESKTESSALPYERTLMQLQSDINIIFEMLRNVESRLTQLENENKGLSINGEDMPKSILEFPFIRNDEQLYNILQETINKRNQGRSVKKRITIDELYYQIIKEYSIKKEIFLEYLLMLSNKNRVLLEPGLSDSGLSVIDSNGNACKFVNILE